MMKGINLSQLTLTVCFTASVVKEDQTYWITGLIVIGLFKLVDTVIEYISPTLLSEEDHKRFAEEKRLEALITRVLHEEGSKQKAAPKKIQERVVYTLNDNELHLLREIAQGKSPDYGLAGPGLKETYDGLLSFGLVAVEYEPLLTRTVQHLKITGEGLKTIKAFQYRDQADLDLASPTKPESEA